ncbi:hypothetical protein [Romboutsia sp. MSSM.1001216sp_RTP31141st1_G3_RTP31141_220114]|uniref:hypothetical protein n=1 Tax=unclassified Romboutsia TaxID=2626894 RepID=UPI0031B64640
MTSLRKEEAYLYLKNFNLYKLQLEKLKISLYKESSKEKLQEMKNIIKSTKLRIDIVEDAYNDLTKVEQKMFRYLYIYEYPIKKIAKKFKISINTVYIKQLKIIKVVANKLD